MSRFLFLLVSAVGLALPSLSLRAQASAPTAAQATPLRMNLKQCLTYALENNVNLRNAKLDERSAEAFMVENRAIGLPQVAANLEANYRPDVPLFAVPGSVVGGDPNTFVGVRFQTKSDANVGIGVNQLIFDGRYILALRAAKVYGELSRRATRRTRQETVSGVTKAYYAVLVNARRVELVAANRDRLQKLVADTKAAADQGLAENVDYQRTQVSLTNLETALESAKAFLELSQNLLKFQMGLPVTQAVELTDTINATIDPVELENGLASQLDPNQRPEFELLKTQQRLNWLDIQRWRVGYLPTLYGNYAIGSGTFADPFFDMFSNKTFWFARQSIGFSLNIPIFDGLDKQAKIRQARYKYEKSINDEEQLLNNFNLELANARTTLANALRTLESQKRNSELASEVYRVAQVKYQQGVGSSLEVVQAESEYKTAQNNYINALLDVLTARVDLQKALGTLGDDLN